MYKYILKLSVLLVMSLLSLQLMASDSTWVVNAPVGDSVSYQVICTDMAYIVGIPLPRMILKFSGQDTVVVASVGSGTVLGVKDLYDETLVMIQSDQNSKIFYVYTFIGDPLKQEGDKVGLGTPVGMIPNGDGSKRLELGLWYGIDQKLSALNCSFPVTVQLSDDGLD